MRTVENVIALPSQTTPSVEIRSTYFGCILSEIEAEPFGSRFVRGALSALATICVGLALATWVMPASVRGMDMTTFKLAVSVTLAVLGLLLSWSSRDPVRPEVQFDLQRREIRFAERSGTGKARLSASIAMDHVIGVTVDPVVPESEHAILGLRLNGIDETLHVASGLQSDLLPVAARLRQDMRPASQRLEDRLRLRPVSRAA